MAILALLAASLSISGCFFQKPAPEDILSNFNRSMANLSSFHYNLNLKLEGRLPTALAKDVNQLILDFSGDAASPDPTQPEFTLDAKVAGTATDGSLSLQGELVNLSDYTYFRLTDVTLPTLLPVPLGADSRWYKIRHLSPATPDENKLGVAQIPAISVEQLQEFRNLISQTSVAEVLEILPDATVNGQRAYHYRVQLKPDAINQLIGQLNKLAGSKLVTLDPAMLGRYQPEVWINKRTFQLAQLKLSDIYLVNQVPVAFDLTLGLSHQNDKLTIIPPKETEELDTTNLLRQQLGL